MTVLLPTLAVAFAALCAWLIVRIVNRRERWAKWTLAGAVGMPVLYFASIVPATLIRIWFEPLPDHLESAAAKFYWPLKCLLSPILD